MKRILSIFSLFFVLLPLRAQVATVEVSRPYDVNLDGIQKPVIPIYIDDSLHRFDVHFDYSIFNRPYSDLYDFTPYETIQLIYRFLRFFLFLLCAIIILCYTL